MKPAFFVAICALVAMPGLPQTYRQPKPRAQASISTAFGDNILTQIADGGGWQSTITLVNLRNQTATSTVTCYTDNGALYQWQGIGNNNSVQGTIDALSSLQIRTEGSASALTQGWCDVEAPNGSDVAASAIFRYIPTGQEVSVLAQPWDASSLILPFDNTGGYRYGVALADAPPSVYTGEPNDTVSALIYDQSGNQIGSGAFSIAPQGHMVFMLDQQFPAVVGQRGTVVFSISGFGTLAGLGLRAAPSGALTSVSLYEPMSY